VACAGPGGARRSGTLRYEPRGSFRHSRALSPEEAAHWKAIEVKLEEYLQWGMLLMETHASHLRRIAPGHLLTEHPLRGKTRLTLPLQRHLADLIKSGKATVKYFPP
jgi:hypothetical protein